MTENTLHCAPADYIDQAVRLAREDRARLDRLHEEDERKAKLKRFQAAYGATGRTLPDIQAELAERRAMRRQDALDMDRAHEDAARLNRLKNRGSGRKIAQPCTKGGKLFLNSLNCSLPLLGHKRHFRQDLVHL